MSEANELENARLVHQEARDLYASLSHRLSEEQRRDFRVRIARLSSLVRQAESEQLKDEEVTVTLAAAPEKSASRGFFSILSDALKVK